MARTGVDLGTGDVRYELDPRNEELRASGRPYAATVYMRDASGNPTSVQTNRYPADATPSSVDLEADPFPAHIEQLRKTGYAYGTGGVLASMTDPRGNVTHYTHNTSGYLTKIDSPAGAGEASRRVVAITPNADGSPASDVDAKGQKTAYGYDGLGRLTAIRYGTQDGTVDFSVSSVYDANGNLLTGGDAEGTTTFTYDENNAMTSLSRTQNGQTRTSRYAYYANGQLREQTTFANQVVAYGYDAAGRLTSQTDPNDGGRAIAFKYDALSRPVATVFPSGVAREVSYDEADNVDLLTLRNPAGIALQRYDYEYGLASGGVGAEYWNGYVRSVTELDGSTVAYDYDDLGRLMSATRTGTAPYSQGYTYDRNDNRTSVSEGGTTTTATYDAANQLVTEKVGTETTSYAYDRNGNLLSDGSTSYAYDAADKMTKGTLRDGTKLAFGYDGEGQRVSRTVGSERTDYWYDDSGLSLETGANTAKYLREPEGDLLSITSGGTVRNYAVDRLGSVTGLVTPSGELSDAYGYKPYGEPNGVRAQRTTRTATRARTRIRPPGCIRWGRATTTRRPGASRRWIRYPARVGAGRAMTTSPGTRSTTPIRPVCSGESSAGPARASSVRAAGISLAAPDGWAVTYPVVQGGPAGTSLAEPGGPAAMPLGAPPGPLDPILAPSVLTEGACSTETGGSG